MQNVTKFSLLFSFLCISLFAQAQPKNSTPVIDTLPFNTSSQLLVFTVTINGLPVSVAFDTGATLGVANSSTKSTAQLKTLRSTMPVNDANAKRVALKKVRIKSLAVGSHKFTKLTSVLHDMTFLRCNSLYLLGMDVIGKLNWSFDFDKKLVYVSNAPFEAAPGAVLLQPTYKNKRPFVALNVNGIAYPSCLIDMGFTNTCDVPSKPAIDSVFVAQLPPSTQGTYLLSTNGLFGRGRADTVKVLVADSFIVGERNFPKMPVSIESAPTVTKIGLKFFTNYCQQLILNHSTNQYHLQPRAVALPLALPPQVGVDFVSGKLVIVGKSLTHFADSTLVLGQEIASIDGKKASDFADVCAFTLWWQGTVRQPTHQIVKTDGATVLVRRFALATQP